MNINNIFSSYSSIKGIYGNKVTRYIIFGLGFFILFILLSSQYSINTQFIIGYGAVLFMLCVFYFKIDNSFMTLFVKLLGVLIVSRYMYWRTFSSLAYEGFFDFTFSLLLYFAEVFAVIIYLLGLFTSLSPLKRKPIDLKDYHESKYPSVDVLIPTYNEPMEIIENTLLAAVDLDYPEDKFNVYLLDDGGTDQRCNDSDLAKSAEAKSRRKVLQEFCAKVGASYLTREKNIGAKAGNLNAALSHVHADLILILDVDHIPATEFLKNTTGWFLKDEKIFLVQTPHAFYNADPVEKNLGTTGLSISENDMFYKYIQNGHDMWESSFFCGSAAVLRRKYIDEIGGIAGETITEDAETAIKLHDRGYKSVYIDKTMVRGLQAESFDSLILQRIRWTQGMVQIFILKNPFLSKNLKWYQKLSYTSASFFWFFAFSRVVFMIAPFLYLFFGLKIYNANGMEILAYTVPHALMAVSMSYYIYKNVRTPFFSELYETILSFFTLPAIISTLINPRDPTFKVTPKGEDLSKTYVSELGAIFVFLFILIILGFMAALWRLIFHTEDFAVILATSAWNALNLIFVLAALAIVSEKKELRKNIRVPSEENIRIHGDDIEMNGKIVDISEGGIRVAPQDNVYLLNRWKNQKNIKIEIYDINHNIFEIKSRVLRRLGKKGDYVFVFSDIKENFEIRKKLIHLIYGNSIKWSEHEDNRAIMSPARSLMFIAGQSIKNIMFKEAFILLFKKIKKFTLRIKV